MEREIREFIRSANASSAEKTLKNSCIIYTPKYASISLKYYCDKSEVMHWDVCNKKRLSIAIRDIILLDRHAQGKLTDYIFTVLPLPIGKKNTQTL